MAHIAWYNENMELTLKEENNLCGIYIANTYLASL